MSREWGIYPENVQPRQWWGARALIENGRMVLLPDRQNYENNLASDADRADLFWWLENEFDPAIQEKCQAGFFRNWNDKFILNSESGRFHAEATPKNSGGSYLYIGVWEVFSDCTKRCRRCHSIVSPSDVEGYPYVCYTCDENMFEFEVYESEE